MDDDKTLVFHEKLYFHELDCREKLIQRLQLTLAILTGIVGGWMYIFSRLNFSGPSQPFVWAIFLVCFACGSVLLAIACFKFVKALWGHSYDCLPVATEIENYRIQMYDTYKEFSDGPETAAGYFRKFLIQYFSECAAHNAKQNAERYDFLHESVSCIVYSIPFILIAAISFLLGGLAKVQSI
ncbi:hypothetical protein [Stenotrophobium rhamnosiphilum]|uniref:SMODS and SLOG-associating 2TM effector domain-containing protein n=1 Tax=Stenotrophobium rhamnosiphilum TaxID=2029166 RepID=A0A2T5MI79_9GAMM|nr:hypothetical protein [Stenotrophobium rhamnosiphilum]PTU32249.1 hypothetical protein CJD38_06220 [Stenotrophobium rhamnosiphilum]